MATEPTSEPRARRPGWLAARRGSKSETDGSQRSWLFTVARSIVLDERGRPGRPPDDLTIRVRERPTADASDQLVNRELVAAALGRLTQEHRDVLRECYFRGSSVAQAAGALEITPDIVKSRAYYALRALRLAIEELGGVP